MTDHAVRKFRMPLGKWSFRSAAWAVPVGLVFAPAIGFVVMLTWLLFCVDTLGPDPVEHPIPQWRKDLGNVLLAPGMAITNCIPRDTLAGAGWLVKCVVQYFLFGLPYAWSFFFLLFTILGFSPLNRPPLTPPPKEPDAQAYSP